MQLIPKVYYHIKNDSLSRNSFYLMLSTGIMAFLGFFFWVINARVYPAEQLGLATTLISVATLITNFSMLGLNTGIIRYLPKSTQKNTEINTALVLVSLTAVVITLIYFLGIDFFTPKLRFVRENGVYAALFLVFMVFTALNPIMESIVIAYRASGLILGKNTFFSLIKLLLAFLFLSGGAFGLFASVSVAYIGAFFISFVYLVRTFSYRFFLAFARGSIHKMWKFSLANYVTYFITSLPSLLIPIIITNVIGPKTSAFFYIDMMITNLLFAIPIATTQALFAESSHDSTTSKHQLKKALIIMYSLLIPAVFLVFLFGGIVLLIFGTLYVQQGGLLLKILALSALVSPINYIGNVVLNIHHRIQALLISNVISTIVLLSLSYWFISFGLPGIGIAYVVTELVLAIYFLRMLYRQISL